MCAVHAKNIIKSYIFLGCVIPFAINSRDSLKKNHDKSRFVTCRDTDVPMKSKDFY
jgi:hypothetical protein